MFRALLSLENFHIWPSISLVVCSTFMLLTIVWMYRPGAKQRYTAIARQALEQGDMTHD